MKIWKTLKWLFGHPPTLFNTDPAQSKPCSYCGSTKSVWTYVDRFAICEDCIKKVYDSVLLPKDKE